MNAPQWLEGIIAEFARAAGIGTFAFGSRDTAALQFDSGAVLLFEYAYPTLVVMMTVPAELTPENARRVLRYTIPERRRGPLLRAGFFANSGRLFFAVRLPHEAISLPVLNDTFSELRSLTDRFTGGRS